MEEKKKTISLSFDVQHERDQNYKETEHYKEERKLAHSFFQSYASVLCFFLLPYFNFGVFISCCVFFHSLLYLYKHKVVALIMEND